MKHAFLEEEKTRDALSKFILTADRFSLGELCQKFETCFADYQGRKFAVLFNSGGSANLALLQALKNLGRLDDRDYIGFSALTWSTNTMPIIQMNMVPIPLDCDPSTLNAMSGNLTERISDYPLKALFITNALGFAGDLDLIRELCAKKGILLLEDNCESLGTELFSGKTGNFGLASTFSFYIAHHMSTIEGGMVCTDDEKLSEMLKIVRANGWDRNLEKDQQEKWRQRFAIDTEFKAKYTFYDLGYNLRPTEITGFLGLLQMQYLPEAIRKREQTFLFIEEVMKNNCDFIQFEHSHITKLSSFAIPVLCKNKKIRDRYLSRFLNSDIEIRPIIAGNIQNQPFFLKYVNKSFHLPGTDFIDQCGFYCGNYPELTESDVHQIISCLKH